MTCHLPHQNGRANVAFGVVLFNTKFGSLVVDATAPAVIAGDSSNRDPASDAVDRSLEERLEAADLKTTQQ